MKLAELVAELDARGVALRAAEGRLEYHPRRLVEPTLLAEMRRHKEGLLRRLDAQEALGVPSDDGGSFREAPPRELDERQSPDGVPGEFEGELTPDGWPVNAIDIDDLTPCAKCGSYVLWQAAAGDLRGRTPGPWRCMACEPPTRMIALIKRAEYLRHKNSKSSPRY
jgi:hypothetical protein